MRPRTERLLLGCSAILLVAAVALARRPIALAGDRYPVDAAPSAALPDVTGIERAAQSVIAMDPFRFDREPAPLRFQPFPHRVPLPAPIVEPVRPVLVLRAIVGGPPWEALVDGLPGRSGGAVVRSGERSGELVVTTITKDSVIVQGKDTTWRLGMVRTWQ